MSQQCDCIKHIEQKLKELTGDEEARLTVTYAIAGSQMVQVPRIEYTYRAKRKDGEYYKHPKTAVFIPNFCPFCGKEYPR